MVDFRTTFFRDAIITQFINSNNCWMTLLTGEPSTSGAPSREVPTSSGYTLRQLITFTLIGDGYAQNNNLVDFGVASVGGWGTITHYALCNHHLPGNNGQFLYVASFTSPFNIVQYSQVQFAPNTITVLEELT